MIGVYNWGICYRLKDLPVCGSAGLYLVYWSELSFAGEGQKCVCVCVFSVMTSRWCWNGVWFVCVCMRENYIYWMELYECSMTDLHVTSDTRHSCTHKHSTSLVLQGDQSCAGQRFYTFCSILKHTHTHADEKKCVGLNHKHTHPLTYVRHLGHRCELWSNIYTHTHEWNLIKHNWILNHVQH